MTFYKWLKNILNDDTPEGDFARDVYRDNKFPKQVSKWSDIEEYLSHTIANETVISSAKNVYYFYEKDKQHHN